MSGTNDPTLGDEWWGHYKQAVGGPAPVAFSAGEPYNSTTMTRRTMSETLLSPKSAGRENILAKQPARTRRSRSSKKAPATLLNASPKNFRAVVQRYTGRHTGGPINLDFRSVREDNNVGFGSIYFNQVGSQEHQQQQQQQHRQNMIQDEQRCIYSNEHVCLSPPSTVSNPTPDFMEGFAMEDITFDDELLIAAWVN